MLIGFLVGSVERATRLIVGSEALGGMDIEPLVLYLHFALQVGDKAVGNGVVHDTQQYLVCAVVDGGLGVVVLNGGELQGYHGLDGLTDLALFDALGCSLVVELLVAYGERYSVLMIDGFTLALYSPGQLSLACGECNDEFAVG